MTQKILYAVQSKQIEDVISRSLTAQTNGAIVSVGSAGYREQVLPSLKQTGADILLYREGLKGGTDIFELMKSVRENFPEVRIIFMANKQPTTSKLLCSLVFLGIYDILNGDAISPAEIVDHVLRPRNFGDVAKYFHVEYMEEYLPNAPVQSAEAVESGGSKKGGLFGGLLKGFRPLNTKSADHAGPIDIAPEVPAVPAIKVVETPQVDNEAMRSAMLEAARREAQTEIPQIVEQQVMLQTLSMKEEMEGLRESVSRMTVDLREKTASEASLKTQLAEAIKLRQNAEEQLLKFKDTAELTLQQQQAQLIQLQTSKSADWYKEQTDKWLAERAQYKNTISEMRQQINELTATVESVQADRARLGKELEEREQKIENMALSVPRDVTHAIDTVLEDDYVIVPDDEGECRQLAMGDGRVIAFMGTKHGVGNSTVALNTAISLANAGFKTCFIEINRQFPMVAGFFEFNNIALGLDTALAALQQNNTNMAARCIIKPHGVKTANKNTAKIYKRLPGPLHFLLYSNKFVNDCRRGTAAYLSEDDLKNLTYWLTVKERYSYVIVDIQPDDQNALDMFLTSPYRVHQLVMTMTQDTHGIRTAGIMITSLARSRGANLVQNMEFVVNQFSTKNWMTEKTICDILHIPSRRVNKISLDNEGYMNANFAMVPYVLSNGKNKQEYMDLRMHLGR